MNSKLSLHKQNTRRNLLKKAFRIIRRNYGCPGNDGISISEVRKNYEKYENIIWQKIEQGTYEFEQEPKCVVIRDYLGKEREIFVYNILERWFQEYLRLQIEPVIDSKLAEYVYAFRRGKSDTDSYNYILKYNPKFILRIDIKDYFNSINKVKLFANMEELGLDNDLLILVKKSLEPCEGGLPLGNVLSCMLSNFNLKKFDSTFPKNYTRYSDDMMFGFQTKEEIYTTIQTVEYMLSEYNFKLNPTKTRIITNPTLESIR